MIENLHQYFIDLENSKLPRHDNVVYVPSPIKYQDKFKTVDHTTIDGIPLHIKGWKGVETIQSIATAHMYNAIGLTTPAVTLLKTTINPPKDLDHLHYMHSAQQDLMSIKTFKMVLGETLFKKHKLHFSKNQNHKWEILYNQSLQELFLQFMTEECFDKFIGLYLVDELRTEKDRHCANYFLIKPHGNQKFEDIIPIDNEMISILNIQNVQNIANTPFKRHEGFQKFLKAYYHSVTPLSTIDFMSYEQRMNDMRDYLNDGLISDSQIELMKSALNFDYPRAITKTCKHYHLPQYTNSASTPFKYLWDYNRKTIGKDLEL